MPAGSNFALYSRLSSAYSTLDFTRSPIAGKGTCHLLPTTPSMLPTATKHFDRAVAGIEINSCHSSRRVSKRLGWVQIVDFLLHFLKSHVQCCENLVSDPVLACVFFQRLCLAAIAISTFFFTLVWQFAQFILLLESMAFFGTYSLGFIPKQKVRLWTLTLNIIYLLLQCLTIFNLVSQIIISDW